MLAPSPHSRPLLDEREVICHFLSPVQPALSDSGAIATRCPKTTAAALVLKQLLSELVKARWRVWGIVSRFCGEPCGACVVPRVRQSVRFAELRHALCVAETSRKGGAPCSLSLANSVNVP